MNRNLALQEVQNRIKNKNLIKHSLAVEAIMQELAEHFGQDTEKWGLSGLLHDIDYENTAEDPSRHSLEGAEILAGLGVEGDIIHAVKVHNSYHGLSRDSMMDKALYCADPVSGLVTAGALIRPSKNLDEVSAEFILKRFNEKGFARGANREQIQACSELDLTLEEFIEIAVRAMKKIKTDLGL